jgi:MFS family permease
MKLRFEKAEWICIYGYFVIGLMIGKLGPLMIPASETIGLEADQIGFIISSFFTASLVSIITGAIRGKKVANSTYNWFGCALVALGYSAAYFANSFEYLLLSTVVFGVGFGFFQVGVTSASVDAVAKLTLGKRAARMAFFQFFFGLGAAFAPLFVELSENVLGGWHQVFLLNGILGPIFLAALLYWGTSGDKSTIHDPSSDDEEPLKFGWAFGGLLVAAFFYAGLEGSTFNWLPYYWEKQFTGDAIMSGSGIMSGFWILFCLSRLLMGSFVNRVGAVRSLVFGGLSAIAALICWIVFAGNIVAEIIIVMLLASIYGYMIPTQIVVVNHYFPGNTAAVTSLFFVALTLSISAFSIVVGWLGNTFGATSIPYMLLVVAVGFVLPFWVASLRIKDS